MRKTVNKMVESFHLTRKESYEIIEMIKIEEGLTEEQSKYYDFVRAYMDLGSRWDNIEELLDYVNSDDDMLATVVDVWTYDWLYPLSTGVWVAWRY